MKPKRNLLLAASIIFAASPAAFAADVVKTGASGNLELNGSWTGGTAPGTGDNGTWQTGSVLTAAGNALGGNVSWNGLKVTNITGALSIGNNAANSNVMTLGAGGIDMTNALQNVTITNAITLGSSQTWTVAGGRTLQLGSAVNDGRSITSTSGQTLTLAQSGAGTANFTFNPATSGTGFNDGSSFNGFAGNWDIGANVRVTNYRNGATAWGTGTINLSGGTIAQAQGNWTWTNNIVLTNATTSTIDDANGSNTNRYLKLQGIISGGGNLNINDTNNRMDANNGVILTGANTMSGTVTVGTNANLRVGGVVGNDTTTNAGTGGTLGTASVNLNASSATLTFSRSNTHTVNNTISGSGSVNIGGTATTLITGAGSQDVTLGGTNTYSGGTNIKGGTVRVNNSSSLGSGTVAFTGNATLATANGGPATTLSNAVSVAASTTASFDSGYATLTVGGNITGAGNVATTSIGTTILTGTNDYAGTTTVGSGNTLRVNGTHTGTGLVTVNGTLQGTGSLAANVTVSGILSPGASIQSLGVGNVSFTTGSTFAYELNSSTLNGDLLDSTGTLDLAGTVTLSLTELASGTLTLGDKLTLISYSGAWNNGTFNGFADDSTFTLGANQWLINYNDTAGGTNFSGDQSGATSFVTMTVVPEPGAALLGGLGTLFLLRRRRNG